MESKSLVWDYFEIFLFKNMYLLYIKRCNFEYHMGGKISLKNLDLVSNFEIKWQKISISSRSLRFSEQKSRSRLEPWDFVKKISISSRGTRLKEAKSRSRLESQKRHLATLWFMTNTINRCPIHCNGSERDCRWLLLFHFRGGTSLGTWTFLLENFLTGWH